MEPILNFFLPKELSEVKVKQTIARVPGGAEGHYAQWVEACIAGLGKKHVSSPFEIAGPLTEALLMANLAISGFDIRQPKVMAKDLIIPAVI